MTIRCNLREHLALGRFVVKWLGISAVLGTVVGALVALFLWSLDEVTQLHWEHPWML